ncbi:MAG: FAD binding domain-containing protein [Nitrososphaerota archaeon]|jgi:xanthine dehydrogenase YagS FAD-binding subunit|nr:FAD binding domain-containing protein [Nitrososphaerota archaeon]MDG6903883.1 FAD binding domain-containing protein [Nitrososphaerota archaeon]MDG6912475.1 FAD binding domain-containing protein [Nitrososphaerota archaeon]MDG6919205.1 FAD binding domain-containing protein [Nitrososphaerota archaeon]MDG6920610.1 FAD binding domain-containing protein [Nitrososphaerota archaeon]
MSSNNEVPKFGLLVPSTTEQAVSLLTQYGGQAKIMSGGTDLLYTMKNGVKYKTPEYVVDISGLPLNYINYDATDGLRIGATTPIASIASDPNIAQYYPVLNQAANTVAAPQLRNQGTAAGDVIQDTWCWYLRNNYPCWQNGGNVCFGVLGDNRYYQSIFGGRLTYAVNPGDTPVAYFALNADVAVQGPGGTTNMPISQLLPGEAIVDGKVKENSLQHNEMVTEIHVPPPPANSKSSWYKVRARQSFDFALASAAVVLTFNGSTISHASLVLGGVDVAPHRATAAESYLVGQSLTPSTIQEAAVKAVEGAAPLTTGTGNSFRVFLTQGAVTKALTLLS